MLSRFQSYLYGLILTDGSIYENTRNRGKITIELNAKDKELLQKIQNELPAAKITDRTRSTNFKKDASSSSLTIYQKSIRDEIIGWGIPKHDKSITGSTPNQEYSENDFWRGVIDGNGSIGYTLQNEPFVSLATKSESLKNAFIKMLSQRFGIRKNINPNKRDNIYNIVLKNEDAIVFCKYIYDSASIFMDRKYNTAESFKTWQRTKTRRHERSWSHDEIAFIQTHTIKDSTKTLNRSEQSVKTKLWRLKRSNKH